MKRFLILFMVLQAFCLCTFASEFGDFPYKIIKDSGKMTTDNDTWSTKVSKKTEKYIVKSGLVFYNQDGEEIASTNCDYIFMSGGRLIGYSNRTLNFYEINLLDGKISEQALTEEEVQTLFPKHTIIMLSEFENPTNSVKIKKSRRNFKIILFNDTNNTFDNYAFTSGNSKFKNYPLTGFINVKSKGMIQFSTTKGNSKTSPWFVILVR